MLLMMGPRAACVMKHALILLYADINVHLFCFQLLSRGQTYVVTLDIELPESPENVQHGTSNTWLKHMKGASYIINFLTNVEKA